ncbi:MAG: DUF2478 domain-containing protein [Chlorobi bacterium]|nr:DUF2478 domain-containing protein [Chlorobiota bacterium]
MSLKQVNKNNLSEVWLKASILGSNWAASEIILGSFLHNLHFPFKGNILTAIGLVLMISVAHIWKDKGLFWRSGLICALMKTMSPSAVIFGPMVAIFFESVLLEISTRILGRNFIGFFAGSALAMLWILFQRIINIIIFYGFNIVEIYADLLRYAEKELGISFDTLWMPVLLLAGAYVMFGLFTAIVAVRIGKQVKKNPMHLNLKYPDENIQYKVKPGAGFQYSITWLVFSFVALISALVINSRFSPVVWMPLSVALVALWVMRYKRAMRQISRPKFWISFGIITILASLLFSYFNDAGWKEGFLIGLQMNYRAAVVVVGFAVLSTELYNPVIRNFLAGSVFKQIPVALEISFESLPYVIANLPDARRFLKNPAYVIRLLVRFAEERYKELKQEVYSDVFIVSGNVAEGKTTFLGNLATVLKDKGISVGGVYSKRIVANGDTIGYNIVSFTSGKDVQYLQLKDGKVNNEIGRWKVIPGSFGVAKEIFRAELEEEKKVVIIDEAGKLEICGGGWKDEIDSRLKRRGSVLVLSVRKKYVEDVIKTFHIHNPHIIDVADEKALKKLVSLIEKSLQ